MENPREWEAYQAGSDRTAKGKRDLMYGLRGAIPRRPKKGLRVGPTGGNLATQLRRERSTTPIGGRRSNGGNGGGGSISFISVLGEYSRVSGKMVTRESRRCSVWGCEAHKEGMEAVLYVRVKKGRVSSRTIVVRERRKKERVLLLEGIGEKRALDRSRPLKPNAPGAEAKPPRAERKGGEHTGQSGPLPCERGRRR